MSRRQVQNSTASLITLVVFACIIVFLKPGGESTSQPAGPAKPPQRPAGEAVAMATNLAALHITLGLKDKQDTDWDGEVSLSEGKVLSIDLLQGNAKRKVDGNKFFVRSTLAKAAKKKGALTRPIMNVTLEAPAEAQVKIKTSQGDFAFKLGELALGSTKVFLEGQVAVLREVGALRLTDPQTEDDYPALARAADGKLWLVYNEYQPAKDYVLERVLAGNFEELIPQGHGDQVRMKVFDGKSWSPCLNVTDTGLRIWRPSVTVDGAGAVHVFWSQQLDDNWELFHRSFTPAANGPGQWSDSKRLTQAPGADYHVVCTTDSQGKVWLAWQGWRDGNFHILLASLQKDGTLAGEQVISTGKANHWGPAIAADSKGGLFVAYDTYQKGNYDIYLFARRGGESQTVVVAGTPRFEARPSIVCDAKDRIWVAYEEGDEQWGKDYSTKDFEKIGLWSNPGTPLYGERTVKIRCLVEERLAQPEAPLAEAWGEALDNNKSLPRLGLDQAGGLWLLVRHHPLPLGAGEVWNSYALRYDGKGWSAPRRLAQSDNLLDNRPAVAACGAGLMVAYSGDRRTKTQDRQQNDILAALLTATGPVQEPELVDGLTPFRAERKPVHLDETANVARMRNYTIDYQGQKLRLYRGEFHRHTEYTAHRDQDGLLEDAWRYGLDPAGMDWMGDGDHDNGYHDQYCWWQIQKTTDLFHHAPTFVAVHSYERSNVYPNGHRNVIMPRRGIRPLPRGNLKGTEETGTPDTKFLYACLKHFGGVCSSHTSGTNMGTDWRDNDPTFEPVVEIYQGHRHNYEHFGAPRSATDKTQIGGYQPKGFVWNALAKGHKLGFQSSSDHVSTHMSYAVVLTDDLSAKGIIAAFKKRHSYAATDNIILDVRCGGHIMGDIFATAELPTLDIRILGTNQLKRVHIIRDNKYVHTEEPFKADLKFRWTDNEPEAGKTHYYYVRVEQADGSLAWASPMWITYNPKK